MERRVAAAGLSARILKGDEDHVESERWSLYVRPQARSRWVLRAPGLTQEPGVLQVRALAEAVCVHTHAGST